MPYAKASLYLQRALDRDEQPVQMGEKRRRRKRVEVCKRENPQGYHEYGREDLSSLPKLRA